MSQSYVFMKKHKTSSNKSCWFQFYVPCFHGLCAPAHICWGRGICLSGRRWMSLRSFVCIGATPIFFYLFMSVPGNNVMWSPSLLVTAIQRVIVMVTLTKQWRWWQSWCRVLFSVLLELNEPFRKREIKALYRPVSEMLLVRNCCFPIFNT